MRIEFYKHNIGRVERRDVGRVLKSLFLTTGGITKEFENKFAQHLGCRNVVGVTSCTAGLHLSLVALDIHAGDEVITTPMSFISTTNVIEYVGARPVFVDVESNTGNINADLIENAITPRTKAIIVTHLYGLMCDMRKISHIAKKYKLKLIEDAAHSVESERDGVKPGMLSDTASFSFYATKNIACGEGGAIATNCDELDSKLRKLRLHGMSKTAADRYMSGFKHYDMELLGYKYNMFDIQAALLLNQLNNIEIYWQKRMELYNIYRSRLSGIRGIDFPEIPENSKSALHIFTIWVDPAIRDDVISELQNNGVMVAVNFRPIHLMKYYRDKYSFKPGSFPDAEKIGASTITLPFYVKLKKQEIKYVCKKVTDAIK